MMMTKDKIRRRFEELLESEFPNRNATRRLRQFIDDTTEDIYELLEERLAKMTKEHEEYYGVTGMELSATLPLLK